MIFILLFLFPFVFLKCGYVFAESLWTETEDGRKIHIFFLKGEGERRKYPVVLCHGLGARGSYWYFEREGWAYLLSKNGFDVFVPDLRGVGNTGGEMDFSFYDYIYDVKAIFKKVLTVEGVDKLHWIGHSMGGMVIYLSASRYPELSERIASFVAVSSPYTIWSPLNIWKLVTKHFDQILYFMRRSDAIHFALFSRVFWFLSPVFNPLRDFGIFRLEHIVWNVDNVNDDIRKGAMLATGNVSTRVFEKFLMVGLGKEDFGFSLENLTSPSMFIVGVKDYLATPPTVKLAYLRSGAETKKFFLAGVGEGFNADYGHVDINLADISNKEILPIILDFIVGNERGEVENRGMRGTAKLVEGRGSERKRKKVDEIEGNQLGRKGGEGVDRREWIERDRIEIGGVESERVEIERVESERVGSERAGRERTERGKVEMWGAEGKRAGSDDGRTGSNDGRSGSGRGTGGDRRTWGDDVRTWGDDVRTWIDGRAGSDDRRTSGDGLGVGIGRGGEKKGGNPDGEKGGGKPEHISDRLVSYRGERRKNISFLLVQDFGIGSFYLRDFTRELERKRYTYLHPISLFSVDDVVELTEFFCSEFPGIKVGVLHGVAGLVAFKMGENCFDFVFLLGAPMKNLSSFYSLYLKRGGDVSPFVRENIIGSRDLHIFEPIHILDELMVSDFTLRKGQVIHYIVSTGDRASYWWDVGEFISFFQMNSVDIRKYDYTLISYANMNEDLTHIGLIWGKGARKYVYPIIFSYIANLKK